MGRRRPDILCWLFLAVLAGCASSPGEPAEATDLETEQVVREIETIRRARLLPSGPGLAGAITVELSIRPKDPLTLEIVGVRPADQGLGDGLVEVELSWKDFVGTQPTSFGGSARTTVPLGADGEATRTEAFLRQWTFDLPEPDGRVLARRVRLTAKLHPVDVRTLGARTAGRTLEFDAVSTDSFRESQAGLGDGGLTGLLAEPDSPAAHVFLAAVGAAGGADEQPRDIQGLVAAAVAALEPASRPHRDALFGALQFLTGQVHGRSVARWQRWLSLQPASLDNDS